MTEVVPSSKNLIQENPIHLRSTLRTHNNRGDSCCNSLLPTYKHTNPKPNNVLHT